MMKRLSLITAIALASSIVVISCASGRDVDTAAPTEEQSDGFLSRPRFEKPVPRPLGRVLVFWKPVKDADGYEVQSSRFEDFEIVDKTWTVSGTELELSLSGRQTIYLRIRSFAENSVSRWSSVLELREDAL